MIKILFVWYLITGAIKPTDTVEGRKIYSINTPKIKSEYVYRGEIIAYLKTGVFKFDETLED
jgi:hypothetical protein